MRPHQDAPPGLTARVRDVCLRLPETYEEQAWVGRRWRVRGKTFAHIVTVEKGWPPAYARVAGTDGPVCLLMFRSSGPELDALRNTGHPFYAPVWRGDEVGLALDDEPDWQEVAELVTESYCAQAPKHLAAKVDRPGD